ncbi:MAG TPA: Wzz/FepE/Etk N-terminal domain-containing protein [Bacteroidia bacterium]|nr:Wzz/FepE/Etk N-terminal domain-containing protein [Bacteroidia bacterium]
MDKPNVEILRVLYSKRKPILLITLVATLLAIAVTYIVKPKYRSVAYMYPANMVPFFMETSNNNNVSETELLLQFFNSYDVRTGLLRRYQLDRHWNLDTTDPRFRTYFNDAFEEKIVAKQTRYQSVELNVFDTDPDTAQKIAKSLIDEVNKIISKQHVAKFNEFVAVNKAYLTAQRRTLDSLQQCMEVFTKKYHLIDMGSQMKYASLNYYKLMAEGKENAKITESVDEIAEHGPELFRLGTAFQEEARLYAEVENEVSKAIRDFNRKLTYMVVASEPTKPDTKYWPKRGIIAMVTALSSFLLACLYFAYIRRIRELITSIKMPPAISH